MALEDNLQGTEPMSPNLTTREEKSICDIHRPHVLEAFHRFQLHPSPEDKDKVITGTSLLLGVATSPRPTLSHSF